MKMYILIRDDLSKSQQAVQGGHALAQFALDWPELHKQWGNHTIVYLKVPYDQLIEIGSQINNIGMVYSGFFEPDIGNELTALSVYNYKSSEYFNDFKLL